MVKSCIISKNYKIPYHRHRCRKISTHGGDYFHLRLLFFFVCFAFFLSSFLFSCFSPLPAVSAFPPLSAASLPQSPLSSPQSVPSASPRTPRGCGRRHCGRVFYRRAAVNHRPILLDRSFGRSRLFGLSIFCIAHISSSISGLFSLLMLGQVTSICTVAK